MQQNEKRTKIILWAVVAAAVVGCALWLVLPHGGTTDCTAEIWIDGQMVRGIYLPQAADEGRNKAGTASRPTPVRAAPCHPLPGEGQGLSGRPKAAVVSIPRQAL